MAELTMAVGEGGLIVAEVDDRHAGAVTEGLGLASNAGERMTRAATSLEDALAGLQPALQALRAQLERVSPDTVAVEFGLKLGGETGIILAKGTAEVNFKVSMTWGAKG